MTTTVEQHDFRKWVNYRIYLTSLFFIIAFIFIFFRAYQLQVLEHDKLYSLSLNQPTPKITINKNEIEKEIAATQKALEFLDKQKIKNLEYIKKLELLIDAKSKEIDKLTDEKQKIIELTQNDIETIKLILEESNSDKASYFSLIYSFIIGLLSSILASYLFSRRKLIVSKTIVILKLIIYNFPDLLKTYFTINKK